jgi:hypothetical protein
MVSMPSPAIRHLLRVHQRSKQGHSTLSSLVWSIGAGNPDFADSYSVRTLIFKRRAGVMGRQGPSEHLFPHYIM